MNLKTKLCDESIFFKKHHDTVKIIKILNGKGIYTVEDFINSYPEIMSTTPATRNRYRAIQKILRYKYLGEPLVLDVILNKVYTVDDISEKQLNYDFEKLGFYKLYDPLKYTKNCLKENDSCTMMDILLNNQMPFDTFHLQEFYIDYYRQTEKNKLKESQDDEHRDSYTEQSQVVDSKEIQYINRINSLEKKNDELVHLLNQKNEIDSLKKELVSLLNYRNELDTRITSLLRQINALEGGKYNSARK